MTACVYPSSSRNRPFSRDAIIFKNPNLKRSPKIFSLSGIRDGIFTVYSFASFTFYGYITSSQGDHLPDGLIAQSEEHCTGIAKVMGSNPVQA